MYYLGIMFSWCWLFSILAFEMSVLAVARVLDYFYMGVIWLFFHHKKMTSVWFIYEQTTLLSHKTMSQC